MKCIARTSHLQNTRPSTLSYRPQGETSGGKIRDVSGAPAAQPLKRVRPRQTSLAACAGIAPICRSMNVGGNCSKSPSPGMS